MIDPRIFALTRRIALFALAGLFLWAVYSWLTAAPKTRARLSAEQAKGAIESGRDAVETIDANAGAVDRRREILKGAENAIDAAPTGADADAAARRGLCQLSADHCDTGALLDTGP